jgi:hypothetical protein
LDAKMLKQLFRIRGAMNFLTPSAFEQGLNRELIQIFRSYLSIAKRPRECPSLALAKLLVRMQIPDGVSIGDLILGQPSDIGKEVASPQSFVDAYPKANKGKLILRDMQYPLNARNVSYCKPDRVAKRLPTPNEKEGRVIPAIPKERTIPSRVSLKRPGNKFQNLLQIGFHRARRREIAKAESNVVTN